MSLRPQPLPQDLVVSNEPQLSLGASGNTFGFLLIYEGKKGGAENIYISLQLPTN